MPLRAVIQFQEITKRVSDALFGQQDAVLRDLLAKTGDDELVHIIDSTPAADKRLVFRAVPTPRRGAVIEKLSEYSRETILPVLALEELRAMIDATESDDAVDIIQLLPETQRVKVLAGLRKSDPNGLLPLLVFGEETAGGLMKTEFLRMPASATVDGARRLFGKESRAKSHQLYLVDDQGALVGTLGLVRLIQASSDARLGDLMTKDFPSVPPTLDQE